MVVRLRSSTQAQMTAKGSNNNNTNDNDDLTSFIKTICYTTSLCFIVCTIVVVNVLHLFDFQQGGGGTTTAGSSSHRNFDFHLERVNFGKKKNMKKHMKIPPFPRELLNTVYSVSDFDDGLIPPLWYNTSQLGFLTSNEKEQQYDDSSSSISNNSNNNDGKSSPEAAEEERLIAVGGVNYEISGNDVALNSWGPCFPPKKAKTNWDELVNNNNNHEGSGGEAADSSIPPPLLEYPRKVSMTYEKGLHGFCRPGFLIIGAGKCGTSSLYHYLVGHPRVLPAKKKQIHYFKFFTFASMEWYLSHFPTTSSFLSSGALLTGEAAPGYLPYPDVAHRTAKRLPGPKIILIAREPFDRARSSYEYSYVRPALKKLTRMPHGVPGFPVGKSEEYYREHHLFSLEDMIRAELTSLKECLRKNGGAAERGAAERGAKERFSSWAGEEMERRERMGEDPLLDVSYSCYDDGQTTTTTLQSLTKRGRQPTLAPGHQWDELRKTKPHRLIDHLNNYHLIRSIVGRGLYALMLEWWYVSFPKDDIALICSEDLRTRPSETMARMAESFLGLPEFNFDEVVSLGMYNVRGHKGYDKVTSWNETTMTRTKEEDDDDEGGTTTKNNDDISLELQLELKDFFEPYNERLFNLTGHRCDW